jgi:hypothetical protein
MSTVDNLTARVAELEARLTRLDTELDASVPALRLARADRKKMEQAQARVRKANDPATDWTTLDRDEAAKLWPCVRDQLALVERCPSLKPRLNAHQRCELAWRADPHLWVSLAAGRRDGVLHLLRRSGTIALPDADLKALLRAGLPSDYVVAGDLLRVGFGSVHDTAVMPQRALDLVRRVDHDLDAAITEGRVVVTELDLAASKRLAIQFAARDMSA